MKIIILYLYKRFGRKWFNLIHKSLEIFLGSCNAIWEQPKYVEPMCEQTEMWNLGSSRITFLINQKDSLSSYLPNVR